MTVPERLLGAASPVGTLLRLDELQLNFSPAEVVGPEWHFDTWRYPLGWEAPGPPERCGPWETACELVRDYEFSSPDLVRAVYDERECLDGRNMLLEARFYGMRFYLGVRVTEIIDYELPDRRVWGWAYSTLQGHLERGKMRYEVVKHSNTGLVEFIANGYSQRAPDLGPVIKLGWLLFGRHMQLRFYRQSGRRLQALVRDRLAGEDLPPRRQFGNIVLAPSGVRPTAVDRLVVRVHHPGRT